MIMFSKKFIGLLLVFSLLMLIVGSPAIMAEDSRLRATFSWPTEIDPAVGSDYSSSTALTNLYDTLVYPDPDGPMKPHLARDWEISDDNLSYIFYLEEDVKFHDGSKFTAQDVKFSFERLMAVGEGFAYIFEGRIDEINVIDDYTIEFTLEEPFGPFLSTLTRLYIVSKNQVMDNINHDADTYGEYGDYGRDWLMVNDAGTGAYQVVEFDVGHRLLMERFDEYFAEMHPQAPGEFEMIGTTEAVTIRTEMNRRDLDISDMWQTSQAFASLKEIEGIELVGWPDGGQLYLMLNTTAPPLDCVHVRRALAYVFDYDVAINQIFPGSQRARGPVAQVIPGWNPDLYRFEKNYERAQEELQQSEYHGQFSDYPIEYAWTDEVPDLERLALMLQAEASVVGLNLEIVRTPWMSMIDQAAQPETTPHIASVFVNPHYPEAGSILESKYHSSTTGTWEQMEWLQNEEIDNMIEDALKTVDLEARVDIYQEIQEIIVELSPSIFALDNFEQHAYQAEYIDWPQPDNPIPAIGYNFDVRFIGLDTELRAEMR